MAADPPEWLSSWCVRELGAAPVEQLLAASVMSDVAAVRLADGRSVVVKARPDERGRAITCVRVQRALADSGFPCARPLTDATPLGDLIVHAEEWRPGGELTRGESPALARRSAQLLGELMNRLDSIVAFPPLPNPEWVRWDHDGPGLFPANPRHDARAARMTLPEYIGSTATRARERIWRGDLPAVIGHADWESQNLRWKGDEPYAVHDWDSLAWLPEAAIAGAAAGAFASAETPTLASIESSTAFLAAYEHARGRAFGDDEREIAWASSLWPALHNARAEVLYEQPLVAAAALELQAESRLALAGA